MIVAAAQEERFSRIKNDSSFPKLSINYCLAESGISADSLDYIVFYEKPFNKFERILDTYLEISPFGFKNFSSSFILWAKDKLFQKNTLITSLSNTLGSNIDWSTRILFSDHHFSHAASAYYPSPYDEAAILTIDGVGEWATTSLSIGKDNKITTLKEISFPHSLGLLYSAFTYYLGFKVNSGEYKVMGLAPYGSPLFVNTIKDNLIKIKDDGSFYLNLNYFGFAGGLTMTNSKFHDLFGGKPRNPGEPLIQIHMDIASSIQTIIEEILIKMAKETLKLTGMKNLCLAGGVAMNCAANGKIYHAKIFENIWIQPAAGDSGGALGAALAVYHQMLNNPKKILAHHQHDLMNGAFLGPEYSSSEISDTLKDLGAVYHEYSHENMIEYIAKALSKGKAIGWHQGRMEFGSRALGARSILADPRVSDMQKNLNLKIKYRESFRPFAPSILLEDAYEWFDLQHASPYMMLVEKVSQKKSGSIPAVTHVDGSARIQTVDPKTNEPFYNLLKRFKEITGCPILVNTSFNVRGEPIVNTPADAFKCFMGTDLDVLAIGNFVLNKIDQPQSLMVDYRNTILPD